MTRRMSEVITRYDDSAESGKLDMFTQPRFDGTPTTGVTSETLPEPGCVNNSVGTPPGGISLAEQPWFKVWAQSVLGSVDLNNFSDHEERVWWRLLCVASEQEERWHVTMGLPALARMCASTPAKARAALVRFEQRGMVRSDGDGWWIANWEKYQETPEARRQRLKRERDKQRDLSRDESRPMSRQEVRGLEVRSLSDPTDLPESAPQKRPRSPSPKHQPQTPEQRTKLLLDFADEPDIEAEIAFALQHTAYAKSTNDEAYLRGWLRRNRERRAAQPQRGGNHNGNRTPPGRLSDAERADNDAYRAVLRAENEAKYGA